MTKLKVGGVPEHFNMPWHYMVQNKLLKPHDIEIEWIDYPGGTGDLVKSLDSGELDLATLLTEGAIKGIDTGANFKILNFFVDSPLIWGIHVPAASDFQSIEDIKGKRYAISRYGSGSHLISYLDATNRNWPTEALDFVEVGGLEGARKAFKEEKAEIFLWEKFTTKPFVDKGEFRILGECIPPFSSFVICVSNKVWERNKKEIEVILETVLKASTSLSKNQERIKLIADYYHLSESDIRDWLERTKWTIGPDLSRRKLEAALDILRDLKLVTDTLLYEDLVV
ncbi:MAG: ABC transporter substrate-binding protein [Bacteroidota bacterium]